MWFWIINGLVAVSALVWCIYKYYNGNGDFWPKLGIVRIHQSDVVPLRDRFGKVPFQVQDQLMYQKIHEKGLKYAGYMEFRKPVLYLADAELVKHVLVKDFDHFVNRRPPLISEETSDEMLVNKTNQEWKDMRSLLSPTFTTGKIRRMYEIFNDSGLNWVEFLKNRIGESSEIDMKDMSGKYTMDVIASAAFGVDMQAFKSQDNAFTLNAKKMQQGFKGLRTIILLILVLTVPKLLKTLRVPLFDKKPMNFFMETIKSAKKHRKESGIRRNDFLQLLLDTQEGNLAEEPQEQLEKFEKDAQLKEHDSTKNKMKLTEKQLLSQALLFFVAGFDTVETLLVFAAYELALHPEMQDRLAQEINDSMKSNDGKLTYDAVNQLEFLDMFVSETLRRYPPGFRLERYTTKDYKIPDTDIVIPKGIVTVIPAYAMHYDPNYFPNPEKFNPHHFSAENKAKRHPYAYLPFGAGPRNCIAMRFALTEGKTAVAHLVSNFILEPSSKTHIPMKYGKMAGIKPEGGMWLKLSPRQHQH